MKFFGWLLMIVGIAAAVSGLLMTGMAPGGQSTEIDRLVAKVTLVIFGAGLGLAGCVFVVGAELRLWLSAIYEEVGAGQTDKDAAPEPEPVTGRVRAEPVIL